MEINYTDLLKNYNIMIEYTLQNSTAFSMIFHAQKPYAQSPPIYQDGEAKIAKSLERCIEKQIIGIKNGLEMGPGLMIGFVISIGHALKHRKFY